jgi:RNA recognition motif-containing protein
MNLPSLPSMPSPLETQMAAAMGKAKERAAVEAKAKGKVQAVEKQPQQKPSCDPCERTTLVLRKLAKNVTRTSLLEMLDTAGMKGSYDFVYLPMDFKKGKVFGYAIVNFITNNSAELASFHFEAAGVNVDWSDSHQGFDELIQRYRDSPIMHPSMPETSKPMIFSNGLVAPFPNPTKKVQPLAKN